jgi:hypothetical protein
MDLGPAPKANITLLSGTAKHPSWCRTLGDGGQLLNGREGALGESWGLCESQPRLPGLGYNYDDVMFEHSEASLRRLAVMPVADALDAYPSCGSVAIYFEGNTAGG